MLKKIYMSLPIIFVVVSLACTRKSASTNEAKEDSKATVIKESSSQASYVVESVVEGLEVPWSIVFTPDQRMLVSERAGRIRVIENGVLKENPLATLGDVAAEGEGGLLGMAIHPDFATNKWIYVCYTLRDGSGLKEMVKRFREGPQGLGEEKIILDNLPAGATHNGCRLKFGPDRKLYITTGEAGRKELAQKLDSLGGKTLRLNDDGSIPKDNPFVADKSARPEIWSYGHRNAQGIDWQPHSNLMFQTEHGPSGNDAPGGGDEVNIVERGKNYGWPVIHHQMKQAGMESPLLEYTPAIAPAGATFYKSKAIPAWTNNFFFTNLRGQSIIRVVLEDRKVKSSEELFKESYGRLRDIVEGPDGALYFATSNRDGRGQPRTGDDRIMRIRINK